MEEQINITRTQLAAALATWETDATNNKWPPRTDDQRHADNADYLFDMMKA